MFLCGCASTGSAVSAIECSDTGITASDKARMTQSGFLTDYARLAPVADGGGVQCWTYAKDAFDKWAAITARRFAALRGVTPPQ